MSEITYKIEKREYGDLLIILRDGESVLKFESWAGHGYGVISLFEEG